MSKREEEILVPALRFPGFLNEEGWVSDFLGNKSNILRGGSPRPIDSFLTKELDGLNWLKIGDVDKNAKYISFTEERVHIDALSKTREVCPGDLIMSNSMSFGRPYILKIRTCIHDGWIAVTELSEELGRDYLFYFILSESAQRYFSNSAAGGGIKNLNAEIVKLLPVQFPRDKEQKKIAGCLSSIDDLISAQTQNLDALKAHKKGLMQQLFPVEGETLPGLRFLEFEGGKDWEEKKLGDLTDFASGGTPSRDRADYWGGNIPWISAASMHETKIKKSDRHITLLAVDEGARLAPAGTVLLLVRGSMLHKRIPVGIAECEVAFNQDVKALKFKKRVVEKFLLYLLISSESRLLDAVTKTGIGAGKLDTNDLKDFVVSIPPSFQEQQKIADCLNSMDDQITVQTKKLRSLKFHKKGLMQKLFPSIDEIQL